MRQGWIPAASRLALSALMLCGAVPARGEPVGRWQAYIDEASTRFGLPAEWIRRVMRVESGGRTMRGGRPITSSAGAMGLMQLMPRTWAEMRARLRLGPDPHAPRDNILAGSFYLSLMHERFGYPGLFAAYNAGPGRYAAHLASGRALPAETRAYLRAVVANVPPVAPAGRARRGLIFFAMRGRVQPVAQPAADGLFVALRPAAR